MSPSYSLSELADKVQGRLEGDGELRVSGLAPLRSAVAGQLSYLDNRKFLKDIGTVAASAIVVDQDVEIPDGIHRIRVTQPAVVWADLLDLFHPYERCFDGLASSAVVEEGAHLAEGVGLGPNVWVGRGAQIGARTEVYPGCTIGPGVHIGEDCRIYGGVHIYHDCRIGNRAILHAGAVIGADGYGFAQERHDDPSMPVTHRKVPQVGIVVIEDDCEIGAGATIDRAALEETVIGRGSKIDDQVMVGHNVRVGEHCLLVAQCGVSGSTQLGRYVTVAGQSGLAGHIRVGDGATIAARTGILKDVPPGSVMLGSPAIEGLNGRRAWAQIEHLPEFRRLLKSLEKRVAELEDSADE